MTQIKLKTSFPHVWGDLAFQNRWLRLGMMLCLTVAALSLTATTILARRKPQIVALDQCANVTQLSDAPPLEAEVDKAARKYVDLRYSWGPDNLAIHMARAKLFVASQSQKAFDKTIADLQLFSKGKNIGQRVYPTAINVDAKNAKVQIVGDRFTEIQGLKAATILRSTLTYQTGPRTLENPWGIYVVKEEEVQ
jgi:type IV secretory pathway component VirB8